MSGYKASQCKGECYEKVRLHRSHDIVDPEQRLEMLQQRMDMMQGMQQQMMEHMQAQQAMQNDSE